MVPRHQSLILAIYLLRRFSIPLVQLVSSRWLLMFLHFHPPALSFSSSLYSCLFILVAHIHMLGVAVEYQYGIDVKKLKSVPLHSLI